ncbi:transglutaminase family protein [Ramlibacter sp. 2FC]|uniref:transglutaminase family protein n=1 Tax=Ramlibacter sp. 2FC TaxID=2502188 RepID=UPI0010F4C1F1|nr:transglutaminase family protein [Ramlibacter sp. 2FC]
MQLRITHETRYAYAPAVETAQHVACLQPCDTACQTVLSHSLAVLPAPAQRSQARDVYGNHRAFFSLQAPHETLSVTAVSEVRTRPRAPVASRLAWEAVREHLRYRVGSPYDPACEFVFPSPHVPRHPAFADYARPSFAAGRPLREAAQELMARIHLDFSYVAESTEVHTPALEALAQRRGVCQDFAHIMIAGLRAMGLAARYVSGYLLTQPPPGQPRLVGSDASHAWVSVYLPDLPGADQGQGWWDLDPTNHRDGWASPGEDYVTLATGRDYSDISPMRGVIHGGARHTLSVGVTVEPVGEAAAAQAAPSIPKENP